MVSQTLVSNVLIVNKAAVFQETVEKDLLERVEAGIEVVIRPAEQDAVLGCHGHFEQHRPVNAGPQRRRDQGRLVVLLPSRYTRLESSPLSLGRGSG